MKTFTQFETAQAARDYRRDKGTGGWILVCEKTKIATIFPPCMSPTAILNHPMARGITGELIGHG